MPAGVFPFALHAEWYPGISLAEVLYISPQIFSGICPCSALCAYETAAPPAHSAHLMLSVLFFL